MPSGPKNTKFLNRHAEEAREREASAQAAKKSAQKQKAEDDSWRDDEDKQGARKAARAAEKDQKALEAQARKEEKEALLAAEDKEFSKMPSKVSKRDEQRRMAALVRNYDMESRLNAQSSDSADLATRHNKAMAKKEEKLVDGNPNRDNPPTATLGQGGKKDEYQASGVDASVNALDEALKKTKIENRHIGKRARVAYKKFEAANLDSVKKSKPGLRRTQYSDLLWGMWQKCPENPFVQRAVQRAEEGIQRKWCQADEEPSDEEEEEEA